MDNAKATNLFKKVQDNMRKKPKPVAANENAGRGLKGDATSSMQNLIKPNFPKEIHDRFNSLEKEL